jgi:hypothetical protein
MTTIVINWNRDGRRIYLALLPTLLWEHFRALTGFSESDIRTAAEIVKKETGMTLSCICKIFYTVMKTTMDEKQIDVLVGRAGPCVAKCMLLHELDDLIDSYLKGWEQVGLVLPVL